MRVRALLGAARSVVAGCTDAATAWSRLVEHGLLPPSWLDDPGRRFIHDPGDHYRPELPTRDPAFAPTGPHPDRVDDCALVAADVDGMTAAEAAARELVAALAPWDVPPFDHARWWTIPRSRYEFARTDTRPGCHYGLLFAQSSLYAAVPGLPTHFDAAAMSRAWRQAAAAGARITDERLRGRAFADLPDPFAAVATIEAAGYATLEWIGATGATTGVVLVCPRD